MNFKTYKPQTIGSIWYWIIGGVTRLLWRSFNSPWLIIIAIIIAVAIFMTNRSREKNLNKQLKNVKRHFEISAIFTAWLIILHPL